MGPWGLKHFYVGNQFYSKNVKKLIFNIFFYFHAYKICDFIILPEMDQIQK